MAHSLWHAIVIAQRVSDSLACLETLRAGRAHVLLRELTRVCTHAHGPQCEPKKISAEHPRLPVGISNSVVAPAIASINVGETINDHSRLEQPGLGFFHKPPFVTAGK